MKLKNRIQLLILLYLSFTGGGIIFYRIKTFIVGNNLEIMIERVDHVLIVSAIVSLGLIFTPISDKML